MLKGIDSKETLEYVSENDVAEPRTVFVIGNISHRDKLQIFAGALNQDGQIDAGKATVKAFDVLRASLKAVKNLGGKDYSPVTDDVLEMLPFAVLTELVGKAIEFNQLGSAEAKN